MKMIEHVNVLIVDDEVNLVESLADALSAYQNEFNVLIATSAEDARDIIKNTPIRLVVCDIRMSGITGLNLLEEMSPRYPRTNFILMTAYGSEDIRDKSIQGGAVGYIEKPFELDYFVEVIRQYITPRGFRGLGVSGIALVDVLQLLEIERHSLVVKIKEESGLEGFIYFEEGKPVHARCSGKTGVEAFNEIIHWSGGDILSFKLPAGIKPTLNQNLTHLIIEAMHLKDEKERRDDPGRPADEPPAAQHGPEAEQAVRPESNIKSKEDTMNPAKIQLVLNQFKDEVGEGFLATDVWKKDTAMSIAGINSAPKATALFNRVLDTIIKVLGSTEDLFSKELQQTMLRMANKQLIFLVELPGDYRWGILIDESKSSLGLIISVALPAALKELNSLLQ